MSEKIFKLSWKKMAGIKSALGWLAQWRKILKREQLYIWDERDEEAFRIIRTVIQETIADYEGKVHE